MQGSVQAPSVKEGQTQIGVQPATELLNQNRSRALGQLEWSSLRNFKAASGVTRHTRLSLDIFRKWKGNRNSLLGIREPHRDSYPACHLSISQS
jgi:hypothetical protein